LSDSFCMATTQKRLMLFSGRSNPALSARIADKLGIEQGGMLIKTFANGEIYARYDESIRGADVFLVQSPSGRLNAQIMELLIMVQAAKLASARRVTVVLPYYPYSRQDKKSAAREPITARLIATLLEAAGADRVLSMDLHQGQIQGFFSIPVDHMLAVLTKMRPDHNRAETMHFIGDVDGKIAIVVDDMVDTAGSITTAVNTLYDNGAKEVYVTATHGIFSDPARERIRTSPVKEVVVTDTLPVELAPEDTKIKVLSVADILADTIKNVFEDESVSELFAGENQLF
jgi:ribose-phosphate pyrophosphokinase